MIDSVADVAERQQTFPNKSTKVGILLFIVMYFVSQDFQTAVTALLAHTVLSIIM